MTSTLRDGGVGGKENEMLSDAEVGNSECSGRPIFFFFLLKKV